MRLFVGIPLAAGSATQLKEIVKKLRAPGDGMRWTSPESWHITLQFLGECPAGQMQCVAARLDALRAAAVPIRLGQPAIFARSGVFLLDVELTDELTALQRQVVAATAACGFAAERRPYVPHITLAREKQRRGGLDRLKSAAACLPALSGFVAREFLLYESFLGPGGSKYELRGRYHLDESRLPR